MRIVVDVRPAEGALQAYLAPTNADAAEPAADAPASTAPAIRVLEVVYLRAVQDADGHALVPVETSQRAAMTAELSATLTVEAAQREVTLRVLGYDGAVVWSESRSAAENERIDRVWTAAEVATLKKSNQRLLVGSAPARARQRKLRLVAVGGVAMNFRDAIAAVSRLPDVADLKGTAGEVLVRGGADRASSVEVLPQHAEFLRSLRWIPASLAVDGTVTAEFAAGPAQGWLWWLNGSHQVMGYVPDDLARPTAGPRLVALPPLSARPASPPAIKATVSCNGDGGCRPGVVADFSEDELANNPERFSEDPGEFCKPFHNPMRILGEKRFSVIARVSQPAIGSRSTVKSKGTGFLQLDAPPQLASVAAAPSAGNGLMTMVRRWFSGPNAAAIDQALAAPVKLAITRFPLPKVYLDQAGQQSDVRTRMDGDHPIQWEDDIAQYQATDVAIGNLVEFSMRWRSAGYSLGTVAKTLTLIPRQTKRIQKIEWSRSERARRDERSGQLDIENDTVTRERDYSEEVAASLSEWASGSSESTTAGAAAGIGFFYPPVLGGVGGGVGTSFSSAQNAGGRELAGSEQQRLRDAIRRHGDALRKFESTVVTEVSQEEEVTGTTEVIRNINYGHSLTIIYYQILRHLRVDTEFAGVRQCVFVPFAIKPFDVDRAYRWRDAIQASIRSRRYGKALRYLKDYAQQFVGSDIPLGTRSAHPLTFVRGSIYVNLAIARPAASSSVFDAQHWSDLIPFLGVPVLSVFEDLAEQGASRRDVRFQSRYAPGIAARWADRLRLFADATPLDADFTLATQYSYNQSVRIDFTLRNVTVLTRDRLTLLAIKTADLMAAPSGKLPPGSVANLTRVTLRYGTHYAEHSVDVRTGTDDLVSPDGNSTEAASAYLPLDRWEQVNEREEIRRGVNELLEHLNEHTEYYHKAIWWRMDRDRLFMMLDGFLVPGLDDVSIASIVDREPLGVIGNSLVFRIGAGSFVPQDKIDTPKRLYDFYAPEDRTTDPLRISLPTDGLYAQTIMDPCSAVEEHHGSTDWVLTNAEPELGSLDASLLSSRRADPVAGTTPISTPATIINLQNAPDAPAPNGLGAALGVLGSANLFRDLAGLSGTQANAQAAMNTAANLANSFGNKAADATLEAARIASALVLAGMGGVGVIPPAAGTSAAQTVADSVKANNATQTVGQKTAAVSKALKDGLISPEQASQIAGDALKAMNPPAGGGRQQHGIRRQGVGKPNRDFWRYRGESWWWCPSSHGGGAGQLQRTFRCWPHCKGQHPRGGRRRPASGRQCAGPVRRTVELVRPGPQDAAHCRRR